MDELSSWGPLVLRISLGEVASVVTTAFAAIWVGQVIQRRQASDRAARVLLVDLCRDALSDLNGLAHSVECPVTHLSMNLNEVSRQNIRWALQRYSNALHSIEVAAKKAGMEKCLGPLISKIKQGRELLYQQVTDPLVGGQGFDGGDLRQIWGTICENREALIVLQLEIIQQ